MRSAGCRRHAPCAFRLSSGNTYGGCESPAYAAWNNCDDGDTSLRSSGWGALTLLATIAALPATVRCQPVRDALALEAHPQVAQGTWRRWRAPLGRLYESRGYAPLWVREDGAPQAAAHAIVDELAAAGARGLRPHEYGETNLRAVLSQMSTALADQRRLSQLDVALSANVAEFVAHTQAGRIDPRSLGFELDVPRRAADPVDVLEPLARARGADELARLIDALEPRWRRFVLLKQALVRYRTLSRGAWSTTLARPETWQVGAGSAYVDAPALRALLAALGDLPGVSAAGDRDEIVDGKLAAGIESFQARHGLERNGQLDAPTYRALSVPLAQRVLQIELALERLRWLPTQVESPPIVINVPQFKLFAFYTAEDDEDTIAQMDVIVGSDTPLHHTPLFAADMRYVVFNPYWEVPRSILAAELLPRITRDHAWVRREGYEVIWSGQGGRATQQVDDATVAALAAGRARLRQLPGPRNALGRIKFVLPNRHNVYLHDTPAANLFGAARRAFSHGCIRVSAPITLAEYALRGNGGWSRERILQTMERDTARRVDLATPVRVYLIYATALVAESGTVYFFEDLYGHDARLEQALRARTNPDES